jgi:hypothetical protein
MVKTDAMRRVRFDAAERWQMAVAWAGPASLVVGLGAWMLRPAWILPLLGFTWALCLVAFHTHGRRRAPGRVTLVAAGAATFALGVLLTGGSASAAAAGALVAPDVIRRFKLNLLGRRTVAVGDDDGGRGAGQ